MIKNWETKLDGRKWTFNKICNEILNERGIFNLDRFLYPVEEDMLPFESLKNIKEGALRVVDGIRNGKSFFVYYDTDVDGITSGTIMMRYLSNFVNNDKLTPYINEGKAHGLMKDAPCFKNKYDIIIIVDSIQIDWELYHRLLEMGSQIVVLDHHEISSTVLSRQREINLISSMNDYDNSFLCGAGVTLKFCLYLDTLLNTTYADDYYDLAACGICGDMMDVGPESMENRYICSKGFSNLINKAILKIKGSYEMTSTTVSFSVAPLVNAANRMKRNWTAMKLFLSDDDKEINTYVNELKDCREKQNEIVEQVYSQIEEQAKSQMDQKVMFFVLDDAENVAGLTANKVLNQYQRPVIITKEGKNPETGEEQYSGSLRAIGIDDFSRLVNKTHCARAMGHSNAAGFVVLKKDKDEFMRKIEAELKDVEFKQSVVIDIKLSQRQIDKELIRWLKTINKISGQGFPPISVMIEDITDYSVSYMSNGKHTKVVTPKMIFIKWNSTDWENIKEGKSFSAYGTLDQGFFGKTFYLQMIMSDYKLEEKIDLDDI